MKALRFDITLTGDLGTPLRGDTLLGQLCWALVLRDGEAALRKALEGYTEGKPFAVVSDGFPTGFWPKPELPSPVTDASEADIATWQRRKAWSKRKFLPEAAFHKPLIAAYRAVDIAEPAALVEFLQPHNSINRMTGTTGQAPFAPYQSVRLSHARQSDFAYSLFCLIDSDLLTEARLAALLEDVGKVGYGRDASLGLGKFDISRVAPWNVDWIERSRSYVTLAPSSPVPGTVDAAGSFWRPFTRFGRHGGPAFWGNVFKSPVLLADTGALVEMVQPAGSTAFCGRGLGGRGELSRQLPTTIHQAYAPLVPVNLEGWNG